MDTTKKSVRKGPRRSGRPLSFDRDAALHQAMLLFWRHGYEGTSLNALTTALGVTPPSIYAAFGDKKRLFQEVVRLYSAEGTVSERIIDGAATARAAAEELLFTAARGFTGVDTPPGCLMASAAITGSAESSDVQAELAATRRDIEAHLRQRLATAVADGELPASADPAALAGLVMALIQGMSTLARDGATRDHLFAVVKAALAALPVCPQSRSPGRHGHLADPPFIDGKAAARE